MRDISSDAIEAIGAYERDGDWRLEPVRHASALPAAAGALARVLKAPDLAALMVRFTDADAVAVKMQRQYKRFGRLAILLNAGAILVGAIALLGPDMMSAFGGAVTGLDYFGAYVALGQFLLVLGAILTAQIVIRTRAFDKWMRARAEAEISRVELFRRVAIADQETNANELPLLPLQLEYFRRYQLETQLDYYAGRGAQHEYAARSRATRRDLYAAVGSFAAAPLTFLGLSFFGGAELDVLITNFLGNGDARLLGNPILSQLFFAAGVVASGLMSAQASLSLLSQDRRNASRYQATYENLAFLADVYLGPARQAAAEGDREGVLSFVDVVNAQISSEHQEWIALQAEAARPDFDTIAASRLPKLHQRRAGR